MTTTVKVHVNGRYRADVTVTYGNGHTEQVVVEGNYDGSPNPSGERSFSCYPAPVTFVVSEKEAVPEAEAPAATE